MSAKSGRKFLEYKDLKDLPKTQRTQLKRNIRLGELQGQLVNWIALARGDNNFIP